MDDTIITGITGLDKLIIGEIPRKFAFLYSGSPGVGKTLSCLQFLFEGVKQNENGVFITTEDSIEDIEIYAKSIGIPFSDYLNKKIFVVEKPVEELKGGIISLKGLVELIKKHSIKRVIVDSLTFFEYLYTESDVDDIEFRRRVLIFLHQITQNQTTIWATSERPHTDLDNLHYDMMDFLFDGVIVGTRIRKGSTFTPVVTIAKMKGLNHKMGIYPIKMTNDGIHILQKKLN